MMRIFFFSVAFLFPPLWLGTHRLRVKTGEKASFGKHRRLNCHNICSAAANAAGGGGRQANYCNDIQLPFLAHS